VSERLAYLNEWKESKIHQLKAALPLEGRDELRELGSELAARFDRTAQFVGTKLDLLSRVRFRVQPCLRDLWHDHVLFTGEKVTGLIDASACRSENVAADLARLFGSLLADDRAAWKLAIAEYEQQRPLDGNEKALLEALDQSGVLLSGLSWMDRLLLKREQASNLTKNLERLRKIISRLKTLEELLAKNLLW
jgi:Ser/Thr protein kinase RdoA (MazF antagonist)